MEENRNKYLNKRKYIRFKPDDLDIAYIMLSEPDGDSFQPDFSALIIDESLKGCSIVMHPTDKIVRESTLYVKVGKLAPLQSKVVWKKPLEEGLLERIGIMYLE